MSNNNNILMCSRQCWNNITTKLRQSNYYLFELLIFVRIIAISVSMIAINTLVQDKICLVTYNQTAEYCQNIQVDNELSTDYQQSSIKDKVLAESTRYTNYKNLIECIPMFVWSLFVGSFLDNFAAGTGWMLTLNILGDIFTSFVYLHNTYVYNSSAYYMLISSLSIILTGGMTSLLTTVFRYVTLHTDEEHRVFKFVLLEIIFIIGASLAMFMGGQFLVTNTIITDQYPQLRTYTRNFNFSLFCDIISFGLLYLLNKVDVPLKHNAGDEPSCSEIESLLSDHQNTVPYLDESNNTNNNNNNENLTIRQSGQHQRNRTISIKSSNEEVRHFLAVLFDMDNMRQTVQCFLKPRSRHVRLKIFLTYAILFVQLITTTGMQGVLLQFSEKVYNWDATMYSTLSAISQILSMSLLAIGSIVFIKFLTLTDDTLIVISQLSSFARLILLGTFLTPLSYFVALVVGSLSGFTAIATRTKISKMVPEDEVGKIFSLSSSIESLVPFIGSLVFSQLFSLTISFHPGAIYQFSAFLVLLSLVIIVFELYYCAKPDTESNDDRVIE